MPATYTVERIPWTTIPSVNQVVTIEHKRNVDSSWTLDSNNVAVKPNGDLVTPLDISGLDFNTVYNIRATNNCGGSELITSITTPANPCPNPTDIVGTTSIG